MVEKYHHNKLIRDNIPEFIITSGNECETRVMDDGEYQIELKKKLIEEAIELFEATDENLINELGDVLQVLMSIADLYNIPFDEVIKYQLEKEKKIGSFSKKIFLKWSTQPKGK
jgi:predicted house-cleaning noncanonical NTP pyrophosphatase (MazG superfamily)